MVCKNCGTKILEGKVCCPVCGEAVATASTKLETKLVSDPETRINMGEKKNYIGENISQTTEESDFRVSAEAERPSASSEIRIHMGSKTVEREESPKRRCMFCGMAIETGARFCIGCGNKTELGDVPATSAEAAIVKKEKNRRPLYIISSVAAAIVTIAIVVVVLLLSGGTPEKPATISGQQQTTTNATVNSTITDKEQTTAATAEDDTAAEEEQIALTIQEAKTLADSGDYVSAIALIKNAQETQGDDADYQAALKTYSAAYKTEAISSADGLAANGDYIGAWEAVETASAVIGDDSELSAKATEYENAYAMDISAQVDGLLAVNDISAAKALLQNAAKEFPNNESIKSRLEEVNKYKTTSLDSLTPINGGFTWNDGAPEDPFDSDYSSVINYVIYHGGHWGGTASAEYKIDKQYDILQLNISPYSDYGENASAYVQIYVDNVLRYVSPAITQKSGITNVEVDVNGATYLKIVIQKESNGCIMLTDVVLSSVPNYVTSYEKGITSVATLKTINGGFEWDSGLPTNMMSDSYTNVANYLTYHGGHWGGTASAEYYLSGKYKTLSLDMAPYNDFGENAKSVVKIYVDDVLVYTGTLTQKSAKISTGDIDVTNANYLKVVIEKSSDGCVILSDVLLKNAE